MGPLQGYKIIEIAGIGPGQFCGMLLADMGAQIIRLDRPSTGDLGIAMPAKYNLMNRSRPTITADLKTQQGVDLVLRLCEDADAIFEGYRPGVMERLGLGPGQCLAKNERIVYGRMTGYGQNGPLADSVGHDTDYIALAGALNSIGPADRPPPIPLNLIGDSGGGGVFLAMGMLAAMLEVSKSGKGQVVDAAIVDGTASMMTMFYGLMAAGMWKDERQSNLLDGHAPFVKNYETSDKKFVAICAIERRFYGALLDAMEITEIDAADQYKQASWPEHEKIFATTFKRKTRDEWSDILEGTDACAAPILSLNEAPKHVHNEARKTFINRDGIVQPAPAPRFSRTESQIQNSPMEPGENDHQVLLDWGLSESEIPEFLQSGSMPLTRSSA